MWISRAELRRRLRQRDDLIEKITSLEAELRAERERARHREDQLVDRVLTASGRHGLAPEPKAKPQAEPKPVVERPLTALEEAEIAALRQAAIEAGRPPHEGEQYFYANRNGKPFALNVPGEPYILPT